MLVVTSINWCNLVRKYYYIEIDYTKSFWKSENSLVVFGKLSVAIQNNFHAQCICIYKLGWYLTIKRTMCILTWKFNNFLSTIFLLLTNKNLHFKSQQFITTSLLYSKLAQLSWLNYWGSDLNGRHIVFYCTRCCRCANCCPKSGCSF